MIDAIISKRTAPPPAFSKKGLFADASGAPKAA